MEWIQVGTLFISGATLYKLFYDSKKKQQQLEIDRRISVVVDERRRMQQELFKNVTDILDICGRVTSITTERKSMKESSHRVLSSKVNVWINLNRENKYSESLRSNCDKIATFLAAIIDGQDVVGKYSYFRQLHRIRLNIWLLIDNYIEEEERLIEELLKG